MELFNNFYDAKGALENAHKVMNSDEKTRVQKLMAFATAMRAERSIEVLEGFADTGIDAGLWERKYQAALELKSIFSRCESEANAIAEKARKDAYAKAMAERFAKIPDDVREEMSVELTDCGWDFTTEY